MAGTAPRVETRPLTPRARVVRALLIGVSLTFLGLLMAAPLGAVLAQALAKGWVVYMESFSDPDTLAAIPRISSRQQQAMKMPTYRLGSKLLSQSAH